MKNRLSVNVLWIAFLLLSLAAVLLSFQDCMRAFSPSNPRPDAVSYSSYENLVVWISAICVVIFFFRVRLLCVIGNLLLLLQAAIVSVKSVLLTKISLLVLYTILPGGCVWNPKQYELTGWGIALLILCWLLFAFSILMTVMSFLRKKRCAESESLQEAPEMPQGSQTPSAQ